MASGRGAPTDILINRAGTLLEAAIPEPTPAQVEARMVAGLQALADAGYVSVHEAGADTAAMKALETLERQRRLPIRVYVMLSARDRTLSKAWLARGPYRSADGMLTVRAVKAFYDGALGSRGARLLADYADRPGDRGREDRESSLRRSSAARHSPGPSLLAVSRRCGSRRS